jgi:hypothetical protein
MPAPPEPPVIALLPASGNGTLSAINGFVDVTTSRKVTPPVLVDEGDHAGNVNGTFNFSDIDALVGDTGLDVFAFTAAASGIAPAVVVDVEAPTRGLHVHGIVTGTGLRS